MESQLSTGDIFSRKDYYQQSIEHRNIHKCGGYPFSRGVFLNQIVNEIQASRILEIGTSIGYSAYCFALDNKVIVDTIDMVESHGFKARAIWEKMRVDSSINFILGISKDILPTLNLRYDITFFDGFAPNPDEVIEYIRVTNPGGLIISTNLSWNSSTAEYLRQFDEHGLYTQRDDDISFSAFEKSMCDKALELWVKLSKFDDSVR